MRRKVIAGNWKMNMLPSDTIKFMEEIDPLVKDSNNEVILCVPFTDLFYAINYTRDIPYIHIGAQNMHYEESGAYTGEISADMLTSVECEYVIIGHSERRQYFNETDESVNLKVKAALKHGLKPIVCVGETLEQREAGNAIQVVNTQITKDLDGLTLDDLSNIIIAYEPIWAIGTGKTATKEDAEEVIKAIRDMVREIFLSDDVPILYGGSVKPENANELFTMPNIDGGLVGGASLKPDVFEKIVNFDK